MENKKMIGWLRVLKILKVKMQQIMEYCPNLFYKGINRWDISYYYNRLNHFQLFREACETNDMKTIEHILSDSNIDYFEIACFVGNAQIIKLMMDKYDINLNQGLYGVCRGGHLELVNLMLDIGANNLNAGLVGACEGGHLELVKLMIDKGADRFSQGLEGAYCGEHPELVKLMKRYGGIDWGFGFESICTNGRLEILQSIIAEYGVDLESLTLRRGCKGGHMSIVDLMIDKGASDWDGGLKSACLGGHIDLARLMIDKGAIALPYDKNYPVNINKFLAGFAKPMIIQSEPMNH